MRKIQILVAALALFLTMGLQAQTTHEEFVQRYQLLSSKFGPTGLGIETLVNKWEEAFPEDRDMLTAKFLYYYNKAQSTEVKALDQSKYLGAEPVLSLKDSLGKETHYFEVLKFDDDMFTKSIETLDKAIKLNQNDLDLRASKVSALMAYEGESPDMAAQALTALVDYNAVSKPDWKYGGEKIEDEDFCDLVQQYCYTLFKINTPISMEAFRTVSEKMSGYYPRNTGFVSNIGSYYLVYKGDEKSALKYYNKVLKMDPKDYTAVKNCILLSRRARNEKLEKKYLPMLIEISPDENEKVAAQVRFDALKNKKK